MSITGFLKIHDADTGSYFYLFVKSYSEQSPPSETDILSVNLTDGINGWSGEISSSAVAVESKRRKMSVEQHWQNIRQALTEGGESFQYQVKTKTDGSVTLVCKQCVQAEVKFQLCQVVLEAQDDQSTVMRLILDYSLNSLSQARSKIMEYEDARDRLVKERAMAIERFDKVVKTKRKTEKDFYEATARLLNEKKRKCFELNEEVQELRAQIANGVSKGKGPGPSKSSRKLEPVETTYSDDTDVDEGEDQLMDTAAADDEHEASNSLLMLEEETPERKTISRRPRHTHTRNTPSKPVLPKVPFKPTPSQTNSLSKPAIKKTKSASSSNSENVDYEDLIGDL